MASTPKTPKKRVAKKTASAAAKSAVVDANKTIEKIVKDKDHKEKPEVKEHKVEIKEAKNEKIETKEHKNEKIEIKEAKHESKEFKIEGKEHGKDSFKIEKNEAKDHKIEKIELKEHGKEGGKIETKDGGKENVKIEIKDHKENFKEVIDKNTPENPKDLVEGGPVQVDPGDPAVNAGLAQRVANLEGQLATFISNANRPDLSTGALKNEAAPRAKPKKK